jgi:L-histidine N-alpha-methyltransferase
MTRHTPTAVSRALPRADIPMLAEARAGMSAVQKKLPARYFQDRGAWDLQAQLDDQPGAYAVPAETALLAAWAGPGRPEFRSLVELGPGGAAAPRALLPRLGPGAVYVPVHPSADVLDRLARAVQAARSGVPVVSIIGDPGAPLLLPADLPRPALVGWFGSGIGAFHAAAAVKLLRQVRSQLGRDDRLLLGVDLRKDPRRLLAAQADPDGLAAELNRNTLRVANERLGADFDPAAFGHRAFYNRTARRVELHLVSTRRQAVTIPGIGVVELDEGETIRTGVAYKYNLGGVRELLADAGMEVRDWRVDDAAGWVVAEAAALP